MTLTSLVCAHGLTLLFFFSGLQYADSAMDQSGDAADPNGLYGEANDESTTDGGYMDVPADAEPGVCARLCDGSLLSGLLSTISDRCLITLIRTLCLPVDDGLYEDNQYDTVNDTAEDGGGYMDVSAKDDDEDDDF